MYSNTRIAPASARILRTGLCMGVAGGLAEIAVVSLYSTIAGTDAGRVARHVATAVGLHGASASVGIGVHMGLAAVLGIALAGILALVRGAHRAVMPVMLFCLAAVWAVNFFVVLPRLSPGFVHLLPYDVTLASKLAFGAAAAATWQALATGARRHLPRLGATHPAAR
jgi:hypothetical protein